MFDWLKKLFSKPAQTSSPVADKRTSSSSSVVKDGMCTKPCRTCGKPIEYDPSWKYINIGENIRNLGTFIRLRDSNPVFDHLKEGANNLLYMFRP